jgi:hypothetical protein
MIRGRVNLRQIMLRLEVPWKKCGFPIRQKEYLYSFVLSKLFLHFKEGVNASTRL